NRSTPASTSSLSNCHSATSMAASKTPMPPGAWLAKPSSVAETKITASVTKPMLGSSGTSMYIANAQKPRSTMPMPICNSVSGPPGKLTHHPSRPTPRALRGNRGRRADKMGAASGGVGRGGNLGGGGGRGRRKGEADPEQGGFSDQEVPPRHETDFRDLDGGQAPG